MAPVFRVNEKELIGRGTNHLTLCDTTDFALRNTELDAEDPRYDPSHRYHQNPQRVDGRDVYEFELISPGYQSNKRLRATTVQVDRRQAQDRAGADRLRHAHRRSHRCRFNGCRKFF